LQDKEGKKGKKRHSLVYGFFEFLFLQKLKYEKHQFSAQRRHIELQSETHTVNSDLRIPIFEHNQYALRTKTVQNSNPTDHEQTRDEPHKLSLFTPTITIPTLATLKSS